MYELPNSVLDPRPGDVILAHGEDGWRVVVVEDLVAVERLLPMGERGSRRYVPESLQNDSAAATWQDQVQLLVSVHAGRFDTADEAGAAYDAGTFEPPTRHVLMAAAALTLESAVPHGSADT